MTDRQVPDQEPFRRAPAPRAPPRALRSNELVTQLVANNTELALRAAKVSQLEKRNSELEKQLDRVLARYKKSEAVSKGTARPLHRRAVAR